MSGLPLAALLSERMGLRREMWGSSAKRKFEVRKTGELSKKGKRGKEEGSKCR